MGEDKALIREAAVGERRVAVAKALARHPDSSWDDYEWDDMASHVREIFLEQADLAIAAMLSPTPVEERS